METTLQRIKQIAINEGLGLTHLEQSIGASKGVLTRALNKNTDIQSKWLQIIAKKYPKYSLTWLLTGEGRMLKNIKDYEENINYEIPLYNIGVDDNLLKIINNADKNIISTIKIANLPKCDGALTIRGDNMYPLLRSGDIVIFKHLQEMESILYGEMYLVDFVMNDDEYLIVAYLNKSDDENYIRLKSYNTDHGTKDIPKSSIRAMALIKASIRINSIK